MTRLLIVTGNYYPRQGGIVTTIREVASRLAVKGFECTVLTTNEPERLPGEEMVHGVRVIRFSPRFSRLLYGLNPSFYRLAQKKPAVFKDADVVHVHGYHNLLGLQAVYLLRDKPMVYSPHYHAVASTRLNNLLLKIYKPLGRHVFDYPRRMACVSASEARLVRRDFGVDRERITVIGHGVNEKPLEPIIRRKRSRGDIRLLCVGHLMKYKGVQYILGAMHRLLHDFGIVARLEVVGRGDYRKALEHQATRLGIARQVTWNGVVTDNELEKKFEEADLLLLLSRAEAYGIVVAEALARGIPCIVTRSLALSEFTHEPGCFGIDYPPNPRELAALIRKLCSRDVQVGPFTSGKIRTWDEVANDYRVLYQGLLS